MKRDALDAAARAPTATVSSRPGRHVDDDRVSGSTAAIRPLSSAQVTSAIVPCPQAVE